jgi:hypothetical protein
MFPFGETLDYTPPKEMSIEAIAKREGRTPEEVAYDALISDEGRNFLYCPAGVYSLPYRVTLTDTEIFVNSKLRKLQHELERGDAQAPERDRRIVGRRRPRRNDHGRVVPRESFLVLLQSRF